MDFYGDDRKLSELGEHSFSDFLDPDVFHPPSPLSCDYGVNPMDQDWLDTFLDPVLNDRMITEALQPPRIQSEHSYSLANSDDSPDSPMIKVEPAEKEDCDLIPTAITSPLNLTMRTNERQSVDVPCSEAAIAVTNLLKNEDDDDDLITSMDTETPSLPVKQPTIILATSSAFTNSTEQLLLPKVNIKLEPHEAVSPDCSPYHESIGLPPTPPSSNTSDNESCSLSPSRSSPSSPVRQSQIIHHPSSIGTRTLAHTPLFASPVSILDSSQYLIPTSGMLLLSEEEKRTLISEGYPIPNKLPLTKQEEKNLKKIRRKIKNKISAQDSRRKKKEYLESLEKRVESFSQENVDLRKKVESLENNNRSLLSQLQKLQSLVKQIPRPSPTTQTSSCLMVLVLCFAMFLGNCNLSPTTLIGYKTSRVVSAPAPSNKVPLGPAIKDANIDSYATPNLRSRVLLSLREEIDYDAYGPATPFGYKDLFMQWFQDISADLKETTVMHGPEPEEMEPELPHARIERDEFDNLDVDNIAGMPMATTLIDLDGDWAAMEPPMHVNANVTAKVVAISHAHLNTTAA